MGDSPGRFSVLPENDKFLECFDMAIPGNGNVATANFPRIDEALTFSVLKSRAKRKLLVALACEGMQTGVDLKHVGRGFGCCTGHKVFTQSTLMHLKKMVEAGIVLKHDHSSDGRRVLYSLSPAVKVTRDGADFEFDFGFVVARVSADGN